MMQINTYQILVKGIVQGVGFRPTVWHLARECNLKGEVWNDGAGVSIIAIASKQQLEQFTSRLKNDIIELAPLAKIESIDYSLLDKTPKPKDDYKDFSISASHQGQVKTQISPDAATCPDCLNDIISPNNRRYHYPFTNCTHCGPRLSIIKKIPYDRQNTAMSDFPLCPVCGKEYQDPSDRRFHAQPNACASCGPSLSFYTASGELLETEEQALNKAAYYLKQGNIIAIKGLGGIHLACDATNNNSVSQLRERKHRYAKALALMAKDVKQIKGFAELNPDEEKALKSSAAPIVILRAKETHLAQLIAPQVAPGQDSLGFMLPYTPMHHLLMAQLDFPIVLTSGNLSDEPQCINNDDAFKRLGEICDYFLLHNRDIINRLDDSVLRFNKHSYSTLRRARGYAPAPINLPPGFEQTPSILSMGSELKNTFCLIKANSKANKNEQESSKLQAIVSQHMGDLENAPTLRDYHHNLDLYASLFEHEPDVVAIDLHPNYFSTQIGQQLASDKNLKLVEVQHHHAHITAVMGEYGLARKHTGVLGIALDGLGYGSDNTLWGGEFLFCRYQGFERLARFDPIAMLGGAKAMYEPWRNSFAHLLGTQSNNNDDLSWDKISKNYPNLSIIQFLQQKPLKTLSNMLEKGLNSPLASSAGRLFDAVAACLELSVDKASFEGQAAIELEALAKGYLNSASKEQLELLEQSIQSHKHYQGKLIEKDGIKTLVWGQLWHDVLSALDKQENKGKIALAFHVGLSYSLVETIDKLCIPIKDTPPIILSGGVFQNQLLLEKTTQLLIARGYEVLSPQLLPANDGGLSYGQALIAAATNKLV